MHARSSRIPLLAASALVVFAGCARQENERLTLGHDVRLPVFDPSRPHSVSAGPSISSLDRSHWERSVFLVPVHGVAHTPTYAPATAILDNTARQRGEFPTAAGALELREPRTGQEVLQAGASHALAVADAVLIIPRMFASPPLSTHWSPLESYERAPAAAIHVVEPAMPVDLGAEHGGPLEAAADADGPFVVDVDE